MAAEEKPRTPDEIEARIRKLEDERLTLLTYAKVGVALALAFGLSLVWILKILSSAKTEASKVQAKIHAAGSNEIEAIRQSASNEVATAINARLQIRSIRLPLSASGSPVRRFFVRTGSKEKALIVPVAIDSSTSARLTTFYCQEGTFKGMDGVNLLFVFLDDAGNGALTVNLLQPGMKGGITNDDIFEP
jgi:hypothetical protein